MQNLQCVRSRTRVASEREFPDCELDQHSVYFMHGLESGPHGRKSRYLRSRFREVHCADMNLSFFSFKKEHTVLGTVLRRMVSLNWRNLVGAGLEDVLFKTLAIQIAELEKVDPDVLIGSSWGGAIALICIARGHWKGPVVLVAPALKRLCELGAAVNWDEICTAVAESNCRVTVYHGTNDGVIPYAHSVDLRDRCPNVTLVTVEGGDHRLDTPLIAQDVLKVAVLNVLAAPQEEVSS